jgi:hypothetical protein
MREDRRAPNKVIYATVVGPYESSRRIPAIFSDSLPYFTVDG